MSTHIEAMLHEVRCCDCLSTLANHPNPQCGKSAYDAVVTELYHERESHKFDNALPEDERARKAAFEGGYQMACEVIAAAAKLRRNAVKDLPQETLIRDLMSEGEALRTQLSFARGRQRN